MKVKKFNISKPEKYAGKDGNEKTMWHQVGTMTVFQKDDGSVSRIVEIPAIGLKASVFEQKPREEKPEPKVEQQENISAGDVPF